MIALQVESVTFSAGASSILNGVSFEVARGETAGLIGPNGSGKTTLFNCISGFNFPRSGRIIFLGKDITIAPPHLRARLGLGRVFQNCGIFRDLTVLENILTALEGREGPRASLIPWTSRERDRKRTALHHLEEIGLAQKAQSRAGSLSGGQMRLLEIVRTLAFGAELFLLDEPTAGVSPKMKEEVAALIRRLQSLGKTVLIIEHDLTFIEKFCSRIVVMDDGQVVLDGTPDSVRDDVLLQEIYFGASTETAPEMLKKAPAAK